MEKKKNIYREKNRRVYELNVYIELLISFYDFHKLFLIPAQVYFFRWAFLVIVISLETKDVLYRKRENDENVNFRILLS